MNYVIIIFLDLNKQLFKNINNNKYIFKLIKKIAFL